MNEGLIEALKTINPVSEDLSFYAAALIKAAVTALEDMNIRLADAEGRVIIKDATSDNRHEKAFALLCRVLDDNIHICPVDLLGEPWPECEGESDLCGNRAMWECWQKYAYERVDSEQVCRVCGCTKYNACVNEYGDACSWVEPDLCSACAPYAARRPQSPTDSEIEITEDQICKEKNNEGT